MPPLNKEKKGLTLEKLAAYDDVITDALVDKVYYWTTIRKNRGGRFTGMRGLHEEDIADIIRKHVAWGKDPSEAVQKLLQLPGLKKYLTSLKTESDKEQFKRHLRRYVNIYMPDCPFEVTTTNRYTITDHEASVTARRDINPREEIKYLTGVQVAMTEQQEKSLELARKDFSLVYSSRKKTRSLFLGPARFANHDCDPNAKLSTKGYDGMQIVAVKPIDQGEEITVSYGNDYFGEDNEECLCQTCENRQQNGWAPMRRVERNEDEEIEGEKKAEMGTLGDSPDIGAEKDVILAPDDSSPRKRERDETSSEAAPESAIKRVRIEQTTSTPHRHDLLREQTLKKAHASSLRHEIPVSSIEDSSNSNPSLAIFQEMQRIQERDRLLPTPLATQLDETSSSREATPQSPVTGCSKSSEATDATSIDGNHSRDTSNDLPVQLGPDTVADCLTLGVATVKEEVTTTTMSAPWPSPPAEAVEDDSSSELSSLSSQLEFDSEHEQIVARKAPRPHLLRTTRSKSRFDVANRVGTPLTTTSCASPSNPSFEENQRKPGDYMTSSSLLSAKYSKWVECQTCDAHFVQQDGFQTRKECPRCERHSKLYGYPWPKSEKEGKNDREERIFDHRTVHRFVDPEEEKELKKNGGRRGMKIRVKERFSTPRRSEESSEAESGRRRRRVRKTM